MKTSVLIIAHNEEKYIDECLKSVIDQTQKPDEIILIAHNCTDNTVEIAKSHEQIKVIQYNGPEGIIYARIEAISQETTGDIILCIDGDSVASRNWIEEMVKLINTNENILVGSWIKFRGTIFGWLSNTFNKKIFCQKGFRATRFIWGPSFAFLARDKNFIKDIFIRTTTLSEELGLTRNPDDFWLALFISKRGNIETTNKTFVTQNQKEYNSLEAISRSRENKRNGRKMELFFRNNQDIFK